MNAIRGAAGKIVALDYGVTVVWDGATTYQPLPTTTGLLNDIIAMVRPANLRLKHFTIKSDDIAVGAGKLCVYASNTASTSQAWGFTRVAGEWIGLDTDMLMEMSGRSYGTLGPFYVWFDAVPVAGTTSVLTAYFEVS